ncbi:MAG: outer membrane beta-barrel protein [Pseudomonadota bacterium]
MKFSLPALVTAIVVSLPAQASDNFYAGIGATRAGRVSFAPGVSSANGHLSLTGYGGYNFSDSFAIEAGFGDAGSYQSAGLGAQYKLDASRWYIAAKGTVSLGEKWSLAGKVGVDRYSFDLSTPSGQADIVSTRLMYGLGLGYQLSEKLALTLEAEYAGKTRAPNLMLTHRRLQAGLRYAF